MRDIKYLESKDEEVVNKEEKLLKGEWKKKQREENQKKEKELIKKKNEELNARRDRKFTKQGKTAMPRSIKKNVKREKLAVVVDEETQDRRLYLGELEPT